MFVSVFVEDLLQSNESKEGERKRLKFYRKISFGSLEDQIRWTRMSRKLIKLLNYKLNYFQVEYSLRIYFSCDLVLTLFTEELSIIRIVSLVIRIFFYEKCLQNADALFQCMPAIRLVLFDLSLL